MGTCKYFSIRKFNLAKFLEVTNKFLLFKALHLEFKEKSKEVTDHMSFIFAGVNGRKFYSYVLNQIQFSSKRKFFKKKVFFFTVKNAISE